MAFKLIEAAETRWKSVNAPQPVALVRAGAKFENGTELSPSSADSSQRTEKRLRAQERRLTPGSRR
jgi:hypothetical protein